MTGTVLAAGRSPELSKALIKVTIAIKAIRINTSFRIKTP
jgi:hypothetical protein